MRAASRRQMRQCCRRAPRGRWLLSRWDTSVEGSTVDRGRSRGIGVATGYGLGCVAMPLVTLSSSPSRTELAQVAVAVLLAAAVAWATSGRRGAAWVLVGPA